MHIEVSGCALAAAPPSTTDAYVHLLSAHWQTLYDFDAPTAAAAQQGDGQQEAFVQQTCVRFAVGERDACTMTMKSKPKVTPAKITTRDSPPTM